MPMNSLFRQRTAGVAAALAIVLASPAHAQAPTGQALLPAQPGDAVTLTMSPDGRAASRALARGVYQVVQSPATGKLYVASSEAIPNVRGGVIYELDPETLAITGLIHTDEKNFGLALGAQGNVLYVTHSVGNAVSAIDLKEGKVIARTRFTERSSDGSKYGPRELAYDAATDTVYVGGVGDPGRIWALDGKTLDVKASIGNAGKWVTGLLIDRDQNRLYSANGDGEVLVIDLTTNEIRERWRAQDGKSYLLLNLALDPATHRLFVSDHSKEKTIVVFDTRTGKTLRRIDGAGDSMDLVLSPDAKRLYATHREQGTVTAIDTTTYDTLRTWPLPPHPNSLALSPDAGTLYVTVKTPFTKDYSASGVGSIARIRLGE